MVSSVWTTLRNRDLRNPGPYWLVLIILTCILVSIRTLSARLTVHHDCAMYLQGAIWLTQGRPLYAQIVDTNPPLIFYLNTLPVWLATQLNVHSIIAFKLCVDLLLFCSAITCWWVSSARPTTPQRWHIVGPLIVGTCLSGVYISYFGQREELFILTYLPFFLLRWRRSEGLQINTIVAALIGITAGVGFGLKPFFILFPVVAEILWFTAHRRWRNLIQPEIIGALAFLCLYAVHFAFLPAATKAALFDYVMPLVVNGYAITKLSSPDHLWRVSVRPMLLPIAAGVIAISILVVRRNLLLMQMLAWFAIGYAIFVYQNKGWGYQTIPMTYAVLMMACLTVGTGSYLLFHKFHKPKDTAADPESAFARLQAKVIVGLIVLCLCITIVALRVALRQRTDPKRVSPNVRHGQVHNFVHDHAKRGEVVLCTTWAAWPMLRVLELQSGTRHLDKWMLLLSNSLIAKAKTDSERQHWAALRQRTLDEYCQDLRQYKPVLVIVSDPDVKQPDPANSPEFQAELHHNYRLIASMEQQSIWMRNDKLKRSEEIRNISE